MAWGTRIGWAAAAGLVLVAQPVVPGQDQHTDYSSVQQQEPTPAVWEQYRPPIDAVVVDPFRAPAHVGAPGNRGWEYSPVPGQQVRASAAGEVVFAGVVVYNRFVTLRHRDGLRTSYGYLGQIAVTEGDWVEAGQLLGTTTERFFFSVRSEETYLDPSLVLATGRVRLVPHHDPDGRSRLSAYGRGERSG